MIKSQRASGALLSYVQIILSNTISIIYTPFALRMLGQSQYGLFGTANSFTAYLSLLSLGIGGAYIRWSTMYRADHDIEGEQRLNGMYFTIFSIISLVTLIIGMVLVFIAPLVFGNNFNDSEMHDLTILIFLSILNLVIGFFFTPVSMCILAYEKFIIIRVVAIVNILISPVINILIMLLGGKAVEISIATLILSTINYIIYHIYARKRLGMKFIFKGFHLGVFKDIFLFSSFLLLNTITDLITDSTDSIILGAVSGTVAVAIYTVGHNFKNYFLQFSTAVSSVFAPKINQLVASENDNSVLTKYMTKVGRIQFYIVSLILIGYIALGKPFIEIWAGYDYSDAYWIGMFLLLGAYVPLFQNIGIEIQKAKNKHKVRSTVYFLIALLNVIMTIPFAIKWGGIGAAAATFICTIGGNVIFMNIYYQKGIGLNMKYFWSQIISILPSFIPSIVLSIIIMLFVPTNKIIWWLCSACAICVIFAISVYLFAMNEKEKAIFTAPIKKILKKIKK